MVKLLAYAFAVLTALYGATHFATGAPVLGVVTMLSAAATWYIARD